MLVRWLAVAKSCDTFATQRKRTASFTRICDGYIADTKGKIWWPLLDLNQRPSDYES